MGDRKTTHGRDQRSAGIHIFHADGCQVVVHKHLAAEVVLESSRSDTQHCCSDGPGRSMRSSYLGYMSRGFRSSFEEVVLTSETGFRKSMALGFYEAITASTQVPGCLQVGSGPICEYSVLLSLLRMCS